MIMTVAELKQFIATDAADLALEAKLQALELLVRAYTNNNFQDRDVRRECDIISGLFLCESLTPFFAGDTVQITDTMYNKGLFTVATVDDSTFTVKESVKAEEDVTVTKVVYPMDVKIGVANMVKWDLTNREKVGVSAETISRHSVTYYNMDGENSIMGYPKSLMGFLKPYMKARFGRGVRV